MALVASWRDSCELWPICERFVRRGDGFDRSVPLSCSSFFFYIEICVNQKVREEIYLSLDTEEEKSGFWEYEIPRRKKKEKSHASIINKSHIFPSSPPPEKSFP